MLILGDGGIYMYERETLGDTDQCKYICEAVWVRGACVYVPVFSWAGLAQISVYVCKRKSRRDQDTNRLHDIVISVKFVWGGKTLDVAVTFKVMYTIYKTELGVHEGLRVRNKESKEVALTLYDKCIALGDCMTVRLCVCVCVCLRKGKRYPDTSGCSKDYLDKWCVDCKCMCKGACTSNRQDTVNDEGEHEEEKETDRQTQVSVCKN